MDEKQLWETFVKDGRVDDYLAYRKHLDMLGKMELNLCDENQRIGPCDKGTEHRGSR